MARMDPYNPIYMGPPRQSKTGAIIDAATSALQVWAAQKQQQNDDAQMAAALSQQLATLSGPDRATVMTNLAARNPRVAQIVAARLGPPPPPPPPSTIDKAREEITLNQIGYRAEPQIPNFTFDPMQMTPYAPAGLQPLPTDPGARASMRSARDAFVFKPEYAAAGPIATQNDIASLSPSEQTNAMRVQLKTATDAPTLTKEQAATLRATIAAAAQRSGQNAQVEIAKINHPTAPASPTDTNTLVQGVIDNPQSYFALPTDAKKAVVKVTGRVPSKLSQGEVTTMEAAKNTVALVDRATAILDKWQKQGIDISGPMIGRYNAATNTWGGSILPSSLPDAKLAELQGDIAGIQEVLGANKLTELRTLVGGRVPVQAMNIIAAPNLAQNSAMIRGALNTMRDIVNDRHDRLYAGQWGGKPPVVLRSAQTPADGKPGDPMGILP